MKTIDSKVSYISNDVSKYFKIHNRRQGVLGAGNFCLSKYLNDMTFDCRLLTNIFPVYRNEVFEDVVKRSTYGELGQMWLPGGHLFLTSKCRLKIYSFDFIPASRQQISDSGPLGFYFQSVTSPVLQVLESCLYKHTILVVLSSGHVQCWKFTEEYLWSVYAEFDLCNTAGAEVISVVVHRSHSAIYWCEKRTTTSGDSATFCVCKRSLPDELEKIKTKDIGPVHALVHNCPASDVFVIGTNLVVSTSPSEGCIHTHLVLNYEKSTVTLHMGDESVLTELSARPAVDFRTVLLQCLSSITKVGQYSGQVYVQFDPQRCQLALLQEDWKLYLYTTGEGDEDSILSSSTQLPDQSDVEVGSDNWFLVQTVFVLRVENKLRLFSAKLGLPLHEITSPDESAIRGVSVSHIPTVLLAFFTAEDIYVVQKAAAKQDFGNMLLSPPGKSFQTDSLQVAYLSQEKQEAQTAPVVKRMSTLHRRWKEDYVKQPKTRLSQLVDPYMTEFWRLEELVGRIADKSQAPVESDWPTVESEVRCILFSKSSLPLDVQQAQLMWLCEKYPEEMLKILAGDLQYDLDDLDPEQTDQWQRLLGVEGDAAMLGENFLMLFEHTCRLFFKLQPKQLMQFVRCAQKFSEEAVGVSAFVRRKQTFQYYKKALSCLPEPDSSLDVDAAVEVKVQLILASGEDHDTERAIKLYLQHQQWPAAISLILNQPTYSPSRASLIYITMASLAQHQVLSEYAKDIFQLIPSCQSFLTFSDIIEKQPEVKQSQLSMSASSVFCQGPPDISIGSIRPVLNKMLSGDQGN